MARRAADVLGLPQQSTLFELCAANADKGSLTAEELRRRVEAIATKGHRVLVTRASLFAEKAWLCRGCGFAVGYDTYRRIVDAKYYAPPGSNPSKATESERKAWVLAALRQLSEAEVRVAVAGRLDDGAFKSLAQSPALELPGDLSDLFTHIPNFRLDISSTELRKKQRLTA